MTCVIVLRWKYPLANSKWRKVKTWKTLSTFFYVFWHDTSKNVKSRVFWTLKKNVKNVFSNYAWNQQATDVNEDIGIRTSTATEVETTWLLQHISVAIQRGNAVSFLLTTSKSHSNHSNCISACRLCAGRHKINNNNNNNNRICIVPHGCNFGDFSESMWMYHGWVYDADNDWSRDAPIRQCGV